MQRRITKVYLDTSVISALFDERSPEHYKDDAIHVAVAVVNNTDLLISWNFRHLVKVKTRRMVNLVNEVLSYPHIEIIAPPEL
jgi:predicted nucleic acid-binding protein